MSIKSLIFFQINANDSAYCTNDAAKDNVIEQSPVKRESPIKKKKQKKVKITY